MTGCFIKLGHIFKTLALQFSDILLLFRCMDVNRLTQQHFRNPIDKHVRSFEEKIHCGHRYHHDPQS